jgi:hypothetical protein
MKEKLNHYDFSESNYFQIVKNNITPLDLFIISKINDGFSIDEVSKLVEKSFNIEDSKK